MNHVYFDELNMNTLTLIPELFNVICLNYSSHALLYVLAKDSPQSWINIGNQDDQDYDNNVIRLKRRTRR